MTSESPGRKKLADFRAPFLPPSAMPPQPLLDAKEDLQAAHRCHLPPAKFHLEGCDLHLKNLSISFCCILPTPPKCKTLGAKIEMFTYVHSLRAWRNPGRFQKIENIFLILGILQGPKTPNNGKSIKSNT